MRSVWGGLLAASFLVACGDANINQILVSEKQNNAVDQILIEARYEYDKGNYDKALSLSNKALKINPYGEETLVLRSYIYLSKAGLDGFGLSKNLIEQSEAKTKTPATGGTATKDATTENFNSLASIMNIGEGDFAALGTKKTIVDASEYYEPKLATAAREGGSAIVEALNQAIAEICPLIPDTGKNADDARHDCASAPEAPQSTGRSLFAWSLAHLGEAIAFYTVVLYDDNGDGVPNIQEVSKGIQQGNLDQLLNRISALTSAINAIFPTGDSAADSMLNAMFDNLQTTNNSLEAAGVPASVTDSISDSIDNLQSKINNIGGQNSSNDAGVQNEALRNSLTTSVVADLKTKIETATTLTDEQKKQACCSYKAINSEATKPSNCPNYTPTDCASVTPK